MSKFAPNVVLPEPSFPPGTDIHFLSSIQLPDSGQYIGYAGAIPFQPDVPNLGDIAVLDALCSAPGSRVNRVSGPECLVVATTEFFVRILASYTDGMRLFNLEQPCPVMVEQLIQNGNAVALALFTEYCSKHQEEALAVSASLRTPNDWTPFHENEPLELFEGSHYVAHIVVPCVCGENCGGSSPVPIPKAA
jgi:hypothetical protein